MVLDSTGFLLIQSMCRGPPSSSSSSSNNNPSAATMNTNITVEIEDSFLILLELAANNDLDEFKRSVDRDAVAADEVGLWYGRKKGCNRMVLQHRTPLMVAATYGSIGVLSYILSELAVGVNRSCGDDKTTALHCAASGGSEHAVEAVMFLLTAGADRGLEDANGFRPADVIAVSPRLLQVKVVLEELLGGSPMAVKFPELQTSTALLERKEYPVDASLPDIKNSIYSTDEFRMFSFKVRPCSRAYSHDWTECPFVHPGENARRRDPRKYHYSCVPCPDFRKGACRRGDMCEYAHGVFECWLHPAQYRTRLCKDGTSCNRRVCFFAHTNEELRPLYMSTGSAVPSPRSSTSAAMEMAVAMGLVPGSPSSASAVMSPYTPQPMSPSNRPQLNMLTLHLPGSSLQLSRLRSSLSARDMPLDDNSTIQELEAQQLINDLCLSRVGIASARNLSTLTPSNLEDLFASEISSSPRYNQQILLSPINTLLQASLATSAQGRMSPRAVEPISPMGPRMAALAQREKQQTLRSLSSRDLGSSGSVFASWSKWGPPYGSADWGANGEELGRLKQSSSSDLRSTGEEPDLSWVHSLVRESPPEKLVTTAASADGSDQAAALGAWREQMQLETLNSTKIFDHN